VVAADSGLDFALALGVHVDLLVGDLDSVSPAALAVAEAAGVPIERHPTDKDFTDAELALRAAVARGPDHLVVVSGVGDRLDHSLGALTALAHPSLTHLAVEAYWGEAHVQVLRGPASRTLSGDPGDIVSLLALVGDAAGITTSGLRYPLTDEPLIAGTSRGVSNEFLVAHPRVDVRHGSLFVIVPYALRKPLP
jgi:thiamine pyrophosphokinase